MTPILLLGAGRMGGALISGWVRAGAFSPDQLMIRDPGMLHRGTPNPTDEPRTMLTAGYFRNDYYYPYGDTRCNLDEKLYQQLDSTVRQLFAPFFTETDPRYWKLRQDPGIRV